MSGAAARAASSVVELDESDVVFEEDVIKVTFIVL